MRAPVRWATADLGLALLALGRVDEGSACFARAGTVSERVGDRAGHALGMYGDGLLAVEQGSTVSDDPGEAAAMLGRAGELRRRYGRPPSGSEEAASASTASAARRALGGAEYAEAIRRGAARGLNGGL